MDKKPTLTFGSLFAGIGGLDLGFERAGMHCKWQVENNEFCQKVLAKHWPDVARFRDVRECGKHNLEPVDCIIGGFPCQPHSNAGQRKASKDERNLWPEFHRLICELEPRWIVAENVLGLLSSEHGAFFGGILRDLAEAGYDARWQVLSAAQFGAPHLRERVIIVAHTRNVVVRARTDLPGGVGEAPAGTNRKGVSPICGPSTCGSSPLAHAQSPECEWCRDTWAGRDRFANDSATLAHTIDSRRTDAWNIRSGQIPEWQESRWIESTDRTGRSSESDTCSELAYASGQRCEEWNVATRIGNQGQHPRCVETHRGARDTQSCLGRATHGLSSWLDRYRWPARPGQSQEEWEAPRVVTDKKINRTARLKGLGNAVVPALAEYVGRCIMAAEAEREVLA